MLMLPRPELGGHPGHAGRPLRGPHPAPVRRQHPRLPVPWRHPHASWAPCVRNGGIYALPMPARCPAAPCTPASTSSRSAASTRTPRRGTASSSCARTSPTQAQPVRHGDSVTAWNFVMQMRRRQPMGRGEREVHLVLRDRRGQAGPRRGPATHQGRPDAPGHVQHHRKGEGLVRRRADRHERRLARRVERLLPPPTRPRRRVSNSAT